MSRYNYVQNIPIKVAARASIAVAKNTPNLKNYKNTYYHSRFIFTPNTGKNSLKQVLHFL